MNLDDSPGSEVVERAMQEADTRSTPRRVGLLLLAQISALGLGLLGLVYALGMLLVASQATALKIPKGAAYSYLSLDNILTKGLGFLFSAEALVLFGLLGVLALTTYFAGSILPLVPDREEDQDEPDPKRSRLDWIRDLVYPALIVGLLIYITLFEVYYYSIFFLGTTLALVVMVLTLPKVPMSFRRISVSATLVVLLMLAAFGLNLLVRPPLPVATLTKKNGKTEEAELWTQTSSEWVLIKGRVLIDVPRSTVVQARIEGTERNFDDQRTLIELIRGKDQ